MKQIILSQGIPAMFGMTEEGVKLWRNDGMNDFHGKP